MHSHLHQELYRAMAADRVRRAPRAVVPLRRQHPPPIRGRVAYVAGGQLWVADARGGTRRRLTELFGGASGPVWSPTGDRIAFASSADPRARERAPHRRFRRCNRRRPARL